METENYDEYWKDVPNYEGLYQVSNLGNVKSLSRYRGGKSKNYLLPEKLLKIKINNHGRLCVNLSKDGDAKTFIVHQLVAIAFLGHKPNGHTIVVDHIDNNKLNNNLNNLQLITARENITKDMKGFTSKYPGVFLDKRKNKWRSQITINKKKKHLGYFKNEKDAGIAYKNELTNLKTI